MVHLLQAKPSQAKPSQAKPSQAKPNNTNYTFSFTILIVHKTPFLEKSGKGVFYLIPENCKSQSTQRNN